MRRRAALGALLLIGVGVLLGATVFRADIAQATGLDKPVTPVLEQNLDGSGNIKVHEQGTANVNVTNSSLSVTAAAPITDGGLATGLSASPSPGNVLGPFAVQTASALVIHLDPNVSSFSLKYGSSRPAEFLGPAEGGTSDINLALSRPISFDTMVCVGSAAGRCTFSWVGAQP
jgi:hypothetical protein